MRIIIISFFLILFVSSQNKAQDLLNELESIESNNMPLLPEKFLVTKKIFWGKKGLMRNFNRFKLTPENRQNELKLRKSMFRAHQILGFVTLGEMLVQGIIGSQLYNGKDVKNAHKTMGMMVTTGTHSEDWILYPIPTNSQRILMKMQNRVNTSRGIPGFAT